MLRCLGHKLAVGHDPEVDMAEFKRESDASAVLMREAIKATEALKSLITAQSIDEKGKSVSQVATRIGDRVSE